MRKHTVFCETCLSFSLEDSFQGVISKIVRSIDDVSSVDFSPDGNLLASGSYDGNIKLWNVHDGHEIATLRGHSENVISVTFSPDGSLLASGDYNGEIKLWNVKGRDDISWYKAISLAIEDTVHDTRKKN